jgi:hypothetical protein
MHSLTIFKIFIVQIKNHVVMILNRFNAAIFKPFKKIFICTFNLRLWIEQKSSQAY